MKDLLISSILSSYDTDKNNGHCYGSSYDDLFSQFNRDEKLDIIEIGSQKGWSLRAWKDYFPNASVTGIDIVDVVNEKSPDITYVFENVLNIKPDKKYDIVIDDGSHALSDVLYVVNNFKLKKGGVMIIEDCQDPPLWLQKIREIYPESYGIDLRNVNGNYDDYLIIYEIPLI